MSQTISAITTTSSSTVVKSTDGQSTVSDQGFGQALLAMIGSGDTNPDSNSSTLSLLTLAGLVESAGTTGIQGEDDTVAELLLDLEAMLDKLEDQLTKDGNLLAALQGWLQDVQAFLQQRQPATSQAQDGQLEQGLSELAKHPQTISFAIQDAVAQLLSSSKQAQAGAPKSPSDQIQTMLQTLQHMLNGGSRDSKHVKGNVNVDPASNSFMHAHGQKDGQVELKDAIQASKSTSHTAQHNDQESFNAVQTGQVVTAGQLALRHHGSIPFTQRKLHRPVYKPFKNNPIPMS